MQQVTRIFNALAAAGLINVVVALPAPEADIGMNSGPVGGVSAPIPAASSISGSLYGPQSLLGEVRDSASVLYSQS